MEHQLIVEVKSEKPDTETTVDNTNFDNSDTLMLKEEFNIKSEYDEESKWDRIKVEEKLLPAIEADWTADTVDQIKMEFQEPEKLEECSTYFENTDAVGLNEEFDIKIEGYQSDGRDSGSDRAQTKWKREQKYLQVKEEKKLLSCYNCNYTDPTKKGLISHIKKNNCSLGSSLEKTRSVSRIQYRLNICNKCNEAFKSKALLDNHISTVHKSILTRHMHLCKHCDMSFKRKESLFDHILKQHPKFGGTISRKLYECMHCALKITNRSNFIRHMTKHNAQKPFGCTNCDASFKSKLCLDHHILQKHSEFTDSVSHTILGCTECEYKTIRARSLARHIMKHTGTCKFTCNKCDASFRTKVWLDNHILQKHPFCTTSVSHKIHECTHCGYKTTHMQALARHIMEHTGTKLKCTKCDASFALKQSLHNHIVRKHPEFTASVSSKVRECTHCEYKTIRARDFIGHMMKHTRAKVTCTKCDASFTFKQSLDNHIIQKHPEFAASVSCKVHECTHCEYKTTHPGSLNRHIVRHNEAKLKCTKCDASFRLKQSLDDHILRIHPEFTASVSRKIYECTQCEYKITRKDRFNNHLRKHTG
ncbi:unnamed protein product [Acanthoscelides obtectus]|uniref:C2H2-type domain-containing protein n=1 Tax=Acanthoscelides obtectus TaxID=200917 RepID=A0A9P0PEY7_ACAOB|nr:unnamed protein product [Acanthoscelides obtectus]CAK1676190.1 Zinc finger protein 26 [Acanthoscelides obtectus]